MAETKRGTGRKLFLTMGVGKYRLVPPLSRPSQDVDVMSALLMGFGYERAPLQFGDYSSAGHVRDMLANWCADARLGPEDVVVFYFAGHGVVEEADRHYLLCWDSDPRTLAATALATEDVVRLLTRSGLGNLLVVLDTCYGGDGATDGAQLVLRTMARGLSGPLTKGGVWFLSAARSESAADGALALTVGHVIKRVASRTGQRQRFLDLADVVTELNESFEHLTLPQRAALANGLITGVAPFFPNPGYAAHLPEGDTDLEQQSKLARRDLDEHFDPRSRGVAYPTEIGTYFHGRKTARTELVEWLLSADSDERPRVITGSPGCGKSAILGRIVALADANYRAREPSAVFGAESRVPIGWVDVAVHARNKGLEQIVAQIAESLDIDADSPADLLRKIGEQSRRKGRLVVLVDALDEAGSGTAADAGGKGEPRRIARQFLRPLAEIPYLRLLVGTRRELAASLGGDVKIIDLDHTSYRNSRDVPEYVTKVLMAQNQPEISTPYRDLPDLAATVGEAVADRAAGNFLVARMAARTLRSAKQPADVTVAGWQNRLPSGIGEAFEDDLDRFGSEKERAKQLLAPLALAEGQGLPRGQLWTGIASALAGTDYSDEDLSWLLEAAAAYLVEGTEMGRSVYRLYHLALAEYLRDATGCGKTEAQRRTVAVLAKSVPRRQDGEPDWLSAHDYVRRHLATHAAASEQLDDFVVDPGFLLSSEQRALLRAVPTVTRKAGRLARIAYEQVVHQLADPVPLGERAAYLELSARRCGADELARRIADLGLAIPWRTSWAWWSPSGAHRQLLGHSKNVYAVATGDLDGRPVALTGSADGTARIWDLIENRQLGTPLQHDADDSVTAVAIGELGEYSIGVTGDDQGRLCIWDLSTGQRLAGPLHGHTHRVNEIALCTMTDRAVAATAGADGTVRIWDLESGTQRGAAIAGHRGPVTAVKIGQLGDAVVLVTSGADNRIRVWDIETHEEIGDSLIGHAEGINAIALGSLDGRHVVVSASADCTMGVWDLATRRLVGEPVYAHYLGARAIAIGAIGSDPVAVTAGLDAARLWNLRTRQPIGQPLAGHPNGVSAVAVASVEGRPIAITAGMDSTVRVWDLTADQPLAGHTRDVICIYTGVIKERHLAITGSEDTTAIVWDLNSAATQIEPPLVGHEAAVSAVSLIELDSNVVAITGGQDTTIRVWDLNRQATVRWVLHGHTAAVKALAPFRIDNIQFLASGGKDGVVRVWNLNSGKEHCPALIGHNADVDMLAVGDFEGRLLVIAATQWGGSSAWELPQGNPFRLGSSYPDEQRANAIGFVKGRPTTLTSGSDNKILLWDLVTGTSLRNPLVGHTDTIFRGAIDTNNDHPIAVTGDYEGTIRAWSLSDCRPLGVPISGPARFFNDLSIFQQGDQRSAFSAKRNIVQHWSIDSGLQEGEAIDGYQVDVATLAIVEDDNQRVVLCGGKDGLIRARSLSTGRLSGPVLHGHNYSVRGVACERQGSDIVSISFDNTLRVWDLTSRRQRTRLELPAASGTTPTLSLGRRTDGLVAAVSIGANLQIWHIERRALLTEITGHSAGILSSVALMANDTPLLLTGSLDSTARLWNLQTCKPAGNPWEGHTGDVNAVALIFLDDHLIGLTGDDGGTVRMWDAFQGAPIKSSIPDVDRWISTLTTGRMFGQNVVVVGSADGTARVFCLDTQRVVAQLQLVAIPTDFAITEDGLLCAATSMGLVTIQIDPWS
ncbi:caspase family protein [Amycolatopsis thailandensis]|uniref:caspase family protein n=1 Tax=Amycolatopsis thailandensis TaxID=589330 RepID=UPI0037B8D64F